MARKKVGAVPLPTKFTRENSVIVDGFEITHGDTIKVKGQYGVKFKFAYFTTNTETGAQWVDCFELYRGVPQCFRAFKVEDIKRIPQKRKRAKRVV